MCVFVSVYACMCVLCVQARFVCVLGLCVCVLSVYVCVCFYRV